MNTIIKWYVDSFQENPYESQYKSTQSRVRSLQTSIRRAKAMMTGTGGVVSQSNISKAELEDYINRYELLLKRKQEQRKELKDLHDNFAKTDFNARAERYVTKLQSHPKVERICTWAGRLRVYTKMLEAEGEDIGAFCLTVETGSYIPRIVNMTYESRERGHWALNEDRPCLGAYEDILRTYMQSGNLFLYVDAVIHFLEDAGSDDAYTSKEGWIEEKETISLTSDHFCRPLGMGHLQKDTPIKITNPMRTYPFAKDEAYGLEKWEEGKLPTEGETGVVVNGGPIPAVRTESGEYIINYDGVIIEEQV